MHRVAPFFAAVVVLAACGTDVASPVDAAGDVLDATTDVTTSNEASTQDVSTTDATSDASLDTRSCIAAALAAMVATPIVKEVPLPSCGTNPPICCPGNDAGTSCGELDYDFAAQSGDSSRLVTSYDTQADRLDVTLRARAATNGDIPVTIPIAGECGVHVDTAPGPTKDIQVDVPISFVNGDAGTSATFGSIAITSLTTDDVALTGSVTCQLANVGLTLYESVLIEQTSHLLTTALCAQCKCGN